MNKTIAHTILSFLLVQAAHSQNYLYSFGESLQPGGITLANGTVMQGSVITGGTGNPGNNHGISHQSSPAQAGGDFTGTVFSSPNASTPATAMDQVYLMTRIEADPRQSVEQGANLDHVNYVGFHISFSQPTMFYDFYGLALVGLPC